MKSCSTCGRPPESSCEPCLSGNPPPERSADLQAQRVADERARLARVLGQARADLVALPDLLDELTRCLTERSGETGGGHHKVTGSPAPLRLPVVHLVDTRQKPSWHGEDPRSPRWALRWVDEDGADQQHLYPSQPAALEAYDRLDPVARPSASVDPWRASDQYGVAPMLETWVRVVFEEMPEDDRPLLTETATVRSEVSTLLEVWVWICEQLWAEELALDVAKSAGQVRSALGIRPGPRYRCPHCGEHAQLVEGGFLACGTKGHEQSVRDLEAQYRRRPPARTGDLAAEFSDDPADAERLAARIRKWAERRQIRPVRTEGRAALYLPWDVFRLLNPDIASALDARDSVA